MTVSGASRSIAMINGNIWLLSQALSGARLGVLAVFSIIVMVVWLIVHSDLWERPIDRSPQERERAALYNASTALTLAVGVFCGFVMLYAVDLMAVLFTIDDQVYAKVVNRPAHLGDYFGLAWMVASLAT
ncbi:hypothetical protein ACRYCC_15100 [Actinomadura scrupuli]|uniref:hypothetical protein n=1 Tax=Actinomadura scrupuli TaxID=559629 RepID=UPI003D996DB6